jgi:glycosyltransferase involved in cell wall biosynthesis
MTKPKVAVLGVQVPFTRGGAEILCDKLVQELRKRGYPTDLVTLPYIDHRKEAMFREIKAWQELDLSAADLVIGTKFPSYFINHPNKSLWLVHQHRAMYELLATRFSDFHADEQSEAIRRKMFELDRKSISDCKVITTISDNVTARLKRFLDIDSTALLPPLPLGDRYNSAVKGEYILSVGRLCSIKRTDLIVKALPHIPAPARLKIVGIADEPNYEQYLRNEIAKHNLTSRIDFMGRVSDQELLDLYANSHSVFYGPFDEDYGFVTLEGLMSGKPIVTCNDSGGVLSFIKNEVNGLVAEPTTESVSAAFARLFKENDLYQTLSSSSKSELTIPSWDEVIGKLIPSSLNE